MPNRWLLVALVLAACGGVDPVVARDRVKKIAEGSLHTNVTSVRCPSAENKRGSEFTCEVDFEEGGTASMKLVITDQYGNFEPSWTTQVVSRRNLGPAIGESMGEAIDCGSGVVSAPMELECDRADGGKLAIVIGDDGSVTW